MQYKKFTDDIRGSLLKMVNNNLENISEIDTFLNIKSKKAYAPLFTAQANVNSTGI